VDVFFDNLNYPENKYRYNKGSELQNKGFSDGMGLELYTTSHRLYDPQLLIFRQIDPLAEINESISTYSYGQDNPVLYNDPFGLLSDSSKPQVLQTATVTGHKNQSSTSSLPPLLTYRLPKMATDNVLVALLGHR
jgi:RHS repeat-associated protein